MNTIPPQSTDELERLPLPRIGPFVILPPFETPWTFPECLHPPIEIPSQSREAPPIMLHECAYCRTLSPAERCPSCGAPRRAPRTTYRDTWPSAAWMGSAYVEPDKPRSYSPFDDPPEYHDSMP